MVNAVVLSSVVLVIIFSMLSFMTHDHKLQKIVQLHLAAATLRNNMEANLRNNDAWTFTINNVSNEGVFSCYDGTSCADMILPPPPTGGGVAQIPTNAFLQEVRDPSDQVIAGAAHPGLGFNFRGESCNSFSTTNPDANCPFKFEIFWEPICVAPCASPSFVRVHGRLSIGIPEGQKPSFNPGNYEFVIERNSLK